MLPICSTTLNLGVASESASVGHPAPSALPYFPTLSGRCRTRASRTLVLAAALWEGRPLTGHLCTRRDLGIAASHNLAALAAFKADYACVAQLHRSGIQPLGRRLIPSNRRGTVVGLILNKGNLYCLFHRRRPFINVGTLMYSGIGPTVTEADSERISCTYSCRERFACRVPKKRA